MIIYNNLPYNEARYANQPGLHTDVYRLNHELTMDLLLYLLRNVESEM